MCHLSLRHNDSVMKPPRTPAPSGLEFHTNDNKEKKKETTFPLALFFHVAIIVIHTFSLEKEAGHMTRR